MTWLFSWVLAALPTALPTTLPATVPTTLPTTLATTPPSAGAAISGPNAPPLPEPEAARDDHAIVAGELVLKLRGAVVDGAVRATLTGLARRTGLRLVYRRPTVAGWHLVEMPGADVDETGRAAARRAPERDGEGVQPTAMHALLRVPNDPLLDDLWGFSLIEAATAWDVSVGRAGQRLGVVDSGTTRAHIDLQGRVARGWDFISDARRAQDGDGRDDDDADDAGRDTQFHGTHVAGVMLARADDGVGVPGLNWRGKLVSARVLGRGGRGSLVDIVEGAAWMAGLDVEDAPSIGDDQVSVINLSLGSPGRCSAYERDAYQAILDRGVVLVAAAGNTGNATSVGAPASCPGVIAVGAVGPDVALAPYSAFGSRIDVLAPGGDDTGDAADWILSLDGADTEGYRFLFGTSMAAPHVAGVVSLVQAVAPDLEPAMIRDILQESPWTCDGCDDEALLQADHAVATAQDRQREIDGEEGDDVADGDDADDLAIDDDQATDARDGDEPHGEQRENPADGGGGCGATPMSAGLLAIVGVTGRRRWRRS